MIRCAPSPTALGAYVTEQVPLPPLPKRVQTPPPENVPLPSVDQATEPQHHRALVFADHLEAAEQDVQIRRLNYKRDSLQDIFLKAMEV